MSGSSFQEIDPITLVPTSLEIAVRRDNVHLTDHGHLPALTRPEQRTLQPAKPVGGHRLTLTASGARGGAIFLCRAACLGPRMKGPLIVVVHYSYAPRAFRLVATRRLRWMDGRRKCSPASRVRSAMPAATPRAVDGRGPSERQPIRRWPNSCWRPAARRRGAFEPRRSSRDAPCATLPRRAGEQGTQLSENGTNRCLSVLARG
jgi:hypothetical protein